MRTSAKCPAFLGIHSIVSILLVGNAGLGHAFYGESAGGRDWNPARGAVHGAVRDTQWQSSSSRMFPNTGPGQFKRTGQRAESRPRARRQQDNERLQFAQAPFGQTPAPTNSERLADARLGGGKGPAASHNSHQPLELSDETISLKKPESKLRIIETAIFIDQALSSKFSGLSNGLVELNKLVMTIMNQVQHLFEYSSLQVPIRLKLVLIEHMKESERQLGLQMPNPERGDIDAYLSNFCNWQQERLTRETMLWWDHAILLSG